MSDRRNQQRRKLSLFSSTDSECDTNGGANTAVPKHDHLMASLPTITLNRAFEPEELATDFYFTSKHKQPLEQEILFLPKNQKPIEDNLKGTHHSKTRSLYGSGRQQSSYQDISKYKV